MTADLHVHERLGARGFQLVRLLAFFVIGVTLLLYAINLPLWIASLSTPCTSNCSFPQLTTEQFSQLAAAGISVEAYQLYILAIRLGFVLTFVFIGFLLLLRKPQDGF